MATLVVNATTIKTLSGDNTNYTTQHDAANAESITDAVVSGSQQKSGIQYSIERGAMIFDTSLLAGTVLSATLALQLLLDVSDTDFDITVVSGADLANTIVVADYGDLLNDTTSFGLINSSALVAGYNNIVLNATGIAAISVGGTTRFGLRSSRDINSNSPTGNEVVQFDAARLTINTTSGLAGQIAVVETRFHYVGSDGVEYYLQGTPV